MATTLPFVIASTLKQTCNSGGLHMNAYPEGHNQPGVCGKHATNPNLTKYVQSRNPRAKGGWVKRLGTREMRRAAARFHQRQAKKLK